MKTQIHTETALYLLDRERKTISRQPGKGFGSIGEEAVETAELRRDTETLELHEMLTCEVGKPMEMLINVREDGILTYRVTTIVRSIIDVN